MWRCAVRNPAARYHLRDFAHSVASALALGLFVTGLFAVLMAVA